MAGQFIKADPAPIPAFGLYGERPHDPAPHFFHVERVRDRAALHGGNVRPHRHAHLHQISFWFGGMGDYLFDGERRRLAPGTITVMPAGSVHGFAIEGRTDAIVLSVSADFAAQEVEPRAPALGTQMRAPAIVALGRRAATDARRLFHAMEAEHARASPDAAAAIASLCTLALILVRRAGDRAALPSQTGRSLLFERFADQIEERFRARWSVARHAAGLGTTTYLLNACVREVTGDTAAALIQRRFLLEAKRLLLYTALSVAEIAFTLGMEDASHFSRAFRREAGIAPLAWRTAAIADFSRGEAGAQPIAPISDPSLA